MFNVACIYYLVESIYIYIYIYILLDCVEESVGPEDTLHALWTCPQLDSVWRANFEDLREASISASNFLEVIKVA